MLGLAVIALEVVALVDPGRGETLSEHVWMLTEAIPALRIIGVAVLAWAAWHLFGRRR